MLPLTKGHLYNKAKIVKLGNIGNIGSLCQIWIISQVNGFLSIMFQFLLVFHKKISAMFCYSNTNNTFFSGNISCESMAYHLQRI